VEDNLQGTSSARETSEKLARLEKATFIRNGKSLPDINKSHRTNP
jgi:hypothetical protein